jgi:hypothetical protein
MPTPKKRTSIPKVDGQADDAPPAEKKPRGRGATAGGNNKKTDAAKSEDKPVTVL